MNRIFQHFSKSLDYWSSLEYTNNEYCRSVKAKNNLFFIKISFETSQKWIKIGVKTDIYKTEIYDNRTETYLIRSYSENIDDVIIELNKILSTDPDYIKLLRSEKLNRILND
jgi:hypothetical protein